MNVRCKNCQAKLNVPDHKIPKNRDAAFKCPKCGEKIQVKAASEKTATAGTPEPGPIPGFRKTERALVLVTEPALLKSYQSAVRQLGYEVETAANPVDAGLKMEYHVYPLVVLEEGFAQGKVLDQMNTQDMSIRRMTCLVLVSKTLGSGDHMAAMHASVNYIAGPDAAGQPAAVLSAALDDHKKFYTVFNESLKAVGKA